MTLVYVAGQYTDGGTLPRWKRWINYFIAMHHSYQLRKMGYGVFSPICNTPEELFYRTDKNVDYKLFVNFDLLILKHCHVIYLLPSWKDSKGARRELAYANELGLLAVYSLTGMRCLAKASGGF